MAQHIKTDTVKDDELELPPVNDGFISKSTVKPIKKLNFNNVSASSNDNMPNVSTHSLDESLNAPIENVTILEDDDEEKVDTDNLDEFGFSDSDDAIDGEINSILAKNGETEEDFDDAEGKSPLQVELESIAAELKEDTVLKVDNLRNKALLEAQMKAKWASKLMFAKVRTKELKKQHDILVNQLTEMCQKDLGNSSFLALKQKTDNFINNSSEVKALRQSMADNKQVIEFLEYCYEIMKGFGFTIKNSLDAMKMEMGL